MSELVGAWELVEWTANGEPVHGGAAAGRLIYSADGFMSAFLAEADGSSSSLAYSGTWELRGRDGHEVIHRVSLATRASFVGADLVRSVSWSGDDLVLTTPPSRDGWVNRLRWRRAAG